ncbi:class I adenylate-forming enzyme family protein [Maricaulis parjimensis]|uniref:class I adenylate-forming enzyme family protein n=1 Tax=Maricaulis parjimensis TaxID=144023 RepID=UPI00193AB070|nr:AMP-binding protein [Maricaulis parjimensis]
MTETRTRGVFSRLAGLFGGSDGPKAPEGPLRTSKSDPDERPWMAIYRELGITVPEFDDRTMAEHVAEHAAIRGQSPALQTPGRILTYAEYDKLASKLANALTRLGVVKGDVVGLHMPNILQYPIALVALSRLGATGTGVSPLLTPPELIGQLQDCKARILISFAPLAALFKALPGDQLESLRAIITVGPTDLITGEGMPCEPHPTIPTHEFLSLIENEIDVCDQVPTDFNDTFMIQYTGGTTGKPKGAELTVRNLMHNVAQYCAAETLLIGEEVIASGFPYFHAGGLTQLVFAARTGGCTTVLPDPRDTNQFCALMTELPPTRLASVPALWDMLLQTEAFQAIDFSNLQQATTGAAPMPAATAEAITKVIGPQKLTDVFGMTETSPCYTFHPARRRKPGSVGFAVPGADVRIVDLEDGTKTLPPGEEGEIICSGPQVMKGYRNLPEETAHALRQIDGQTWMFSGDVGYMDEEGYIFLCDRAKDMLIVGGYKVFSVEVEDKLKALPFIAASALVGQPDPNRAGNDIVNLFVELMPEAKDRNADEVRQEILDFCTANLAPYKVPKKVHIIDAIPLTPIGKTDKKKLRAELEG